MIRTAQKFAIRAYVYCGGEEPEEEPLEDRHSVPYALGEHGEFDEGGMSLFCLSGGRGAEGALLPLDEDETVVEVVVYDLWPSQMPCYIGSLLGAYHTGIAADVGHHLGPLEYTFEVPDGIKPRRRGRRPIYVQGDAKRFIAVGKCKKETFKEAIVALRDDSRFDDGERYRIMSNNCHTFCDELLSMLGPGVTGKVPVYARFLDDMFSFFVPGGTLRGLESCLDVLGDEDAELCSQRCMAWTALGCVSCILAVSLPVLVAYHLSFS